MRRANLPGVSVHTFSSLTDDKWLEYYRRKRPMFLMGWDGGLPSGDQAPELEAERILVQRQFIVQAVAQKITFVLLQAAEYKDAKVGAAQSSTQLKSSESLGRVLADVLISTTGSHLSLQPYGALLSASVHLTRWRDRPGLAGGCHSRPSRRLGSCLKQSRGRLEERCRKLRASHFPRPQNGS